MFKIYVRLHTPSVKFHYSISAWLLLSLPGPFCCCNWSERVWGPPWVLLDSHTSYPMCQRFLFAHLCTKLWMGPHSPPSHSHAAQTWSSACVTCSGLVSVCLLPSQPLHGLYTPYCSQHGLYKIKDCFVFLLKTHYGNLRASEINGCFCWGQIFLKMSFES